MESQDKSIVMSSPIWLSKILVYIRLQKKKREKERVKRRFQK